MTAPIIAQDPGQPRSQSSPSRTIHVRELPIGAHFRIGDEPYELLAKSDSRAHVRSLRKKRVRIEKAGREFERNGRTLDISPEAEVSEVLG